MYYKQYTATHVKINSPIHHSKNENPLNNYRSRNNFIKVISNENNANFLLSILKKAPYTP